MKSEHCIRKPLHFPGVPLNLSRKASRGLVAAYEVAGGSTGGVGVGVAEIPCKLCSAETSSPMSEVRCVSC